MDSAQEVVRPEHADAAVAIDRDHGGDDARADYLAARARDRGLFVAYAGKQAKGFLCLEPVGFFRRPFVSLLIVHPAHRKSGTGTALLVGAEQAVSGRRLLISTNQSNGPMIALLQKCRYTPCGWVSGIDEGDPELFYFKDTA